MISRDLSPKAARMIALDITIVPSIGDKSGDNSTRVVDK